MRHTGLLQYCCAILIHILLVYPLQCCYRLYIGHYCTTVTIQRHSVLQVLHTVLHRSYSIGLSLTVQVLVLQTLTGPIDSLYTFCTVPTYCMRIHAHIQGILFLGSPYTYRYCALMYYTINSLWSFIQGTMIHIPQSLLYRGILYIQGILYYAHFTLLSLKPTILYFLLQYRLNFIKYIVPTALLYFIY